MGFWDEAIKDLLGPGVRIVLDGVTALFGGADHGGDEHRDLSPAELAELVGQAPLTRPPGLPAGPGSLQRGVDQAGGAYQQAGGAVAVTDDKLREQLKQIFAANDAMRSKITEIITEINENHAKLVSEPTLANDPGAIKGFQLYVDAKLGEIQRLLNDAKVDSKRQAALLAALGDEYRTNTDGDRLKNGGKGDTSGATGGGNGGEGGGTGGGAGGGGSGGDPGGGGGWGPGGGAALTDPLAAGLPGGGLGDPLSMLAPALAGLGSIPGALGGAAGSLPMDALSGLRGLAPLASGLATGHGGGDGFTDDGPRDRSNRADFADDGQGGKPDGGDHKDDGGDHKGDGDKKPASPPGPVVPVDHPTPVAAAPASAGGDAARVVAMPDGSPVTAPTAQHAAAMRTVLSGGSVSDAWRSADVELPPPGTPVTAPADPSHLPPGAVAQFKTREPVMYMGNGKIWLDGQLQPQSVLPAGDFLGWFDPAPQAGAAATPSPVSKVPAGA